MRTKLKLQKIKKELQKPQLFTLVLPESGTAIKKSGPSVCKIASR